MAEQLLILTENLLSDVQFPSHTVAATTEATGYPVDKVANERRNLIERWEPTGTNVDNSITLTCDLLRAADTLVIDRASNHLGYRYQLLGSDDNFTTSQTLWDVNPIPSVPGGTPAGGVGCVTSEGAWMKTWTPTAFNYWRLTSKAMGSGLKPQLTGVYLGKAWTPTQYILRYPLQDSRVTVSFQTASSPYGWRGRGVRARVRSGTLQIALPTYDDEAAFEYHILTRYASGRPMWLVHQKTDAPWRAMMVSCPAGAEITFDRDPSWHPLYRVASIPFEEEQPAIVTG